MLHEQSRGLRSYVPNAAVFWRNIHPLPHGAIILEVGQGRLKNNVGQQKQGDPLHVALRGVELLKAAPCIAL